MKVLIGSIYYPTIDGSSVTTTRSASDPVPTCTVNIVDNASTLTPQELQEILILDDQVIPNPTVNLLQNPSLNPYATGWTIIPNATFSQIAGGGIQAVVSNAASGFDPFFSQSTLSGSIIPGQSYTFSFFIQSSGAVTNLQYGYVINYLDASGNVLGTAPVNTGPITTTLTRISLTAVAPANASGVTLTTGVNATSTTNSGTILYTQIQIEPNWFPTLSYPTPFCGPSQTNCRQLPNGQWIRQYRKFAGFVTLITAQDYHGNVRTLVVNAVGYAWLMSTIFANDTFSSKTDAQIITTLLGKYVLNAGAAMCTTTNVVTGQTITSLQIPWDDLRTTFDNLAAQSTFYWTIDYYWNFIYAPPGYFSMQIGLICDNSSQPDMVTTFPAYNFSHDGDATQPGSNILVIGNGSNVAQVIDPSVIAQIGVISGYSLPVTTSWMRKVNESSLNSVADCTNRGLAELIQYDNPRNIYHLTTNVELTPGDSIQVTSDTDGLNQSTLLIQQTTATWIGTSETRNDTWEYVSDLGATNKAATHILSRLFRLVTANTSAPAISATTLAVIENVGVVDSTGFGTTIYNYAQVVLLDTPLAYYRLNELTGTIADDSSGNAQQGTLNGGITMFVAGLLSDAADTSDAAMSFNGSTGYIQLPSTGTWPTGNGAWSVECWCKPTNSTNANNGHLVTIGNPGTNGAVGAIAQTSTGGWTIATWGGAGHDFNGNGTSTAGNTYYVVATYDGASNLNLYVTAGGAISHYGPFNPGTLNLTASALQSIGDGGSLANFFNGTIDEPAVYNYKLSTTQIATHFAAGTSIYAYAVMQDTPLNYYRLGEASGTTANDTSGNGHNGTITGGVTLGTTGLIFNDANTAMTFNGSTGFVSLPTTGLPTGSHAWTLEAWCRISSIPAGGTYCMASWGTTSSLQMTAISLFSSGTTAQFLCDLGGGNHAAGPFTVATSTTYHVIATYDGTNLRLYVNGALTAGPTAFTPNLTLTYATIGSESSSFDFFPGIIDEAAFYNTALSASRITAHYNAGTLGHQ